MLLKPRNGYEFLFTNICINSQLFFYIISVDIYRAILFKKIYKKYKFCRLRLERGNQLLVGQELGVINFVCQAIDILPQS